MTSAATKDSTASIIVPTSSQGPMPSRVNKISSIDELEQHFAESAEKPLLIEFYAEWCGPCKVIAAKLEEWALIYEVTIRKIDVDELEDVALEHNVGGIPTFVLIKDQQKVEQLEGSQEDRIIAALEKHCSKNAEYTKAVTGLLGSPEANAAKTLPITENQTSESNTDLNPKKTDD